MARQCFGHWHPIGTTAASTCVSRKVVSRRSSRGSRPELGSKCNIAAWSTCTAYCSLHLLVAGGRRLIRPSGTNTCLGRSRLDAYSRSAGGVAPGGGCANRGRDTRFARVQSSMRMSLYARQTRDKARLDASNMARFTLLFPQATEMSTKLFPACIEFPSHFPP